jgi:putative toxin-antitoxin system antitoxin component (TIGR02293 family)
MSRDALGSRTCLRGGATKVQCPSSSAARMPARVRSERMSLSNCANAASTRIGRHLTTRATWPIIVGQMASTQASTATTHHADETTRDVERFRQFLDRGSPGPHAYVVLLGLETFAAQDLLRAVGKGFVYRTFERFQRNTALPFDFLLALIDVPRRTLTRRKREGRFLPDESDRLLRASRLFGRTLELFEGDRQAATDWLTSAQPALGGATPLDLARTDVGAREVERLIHRLEHGVFS